MDRTPLPGLPSFPPPALPNPPSKSLLALQGLDQALVDAEVVDPATLQTISLESEATETGLGERTRKRLIELGITELFAGLFVSLVHRLHPRERFPLFQYKRDFYRFCFQPTLSRELCIFLMILLVMSACQLPQEVVKPWHTCCPLSK